MESVLVALVTTLLSPVVLLLVGAVLNRRQERHVESLKKTIETNTSSNSVDHGQVVRSLETLTEKVDQLHAWTVSHDREHVLINEIITR